MDLFLTSMELFFNPHSHQFPRILEHELSNCLFVWLQLNDEPFPNRTSVCSPNHVGVIAKYLE
jgi:hypothetical protein